MTTMMIVMVIANEELSDIFLFFRVWSKYEEKNIFLKIIILETILTTARQQQRNITINNHQAVLSIPGGSSNDDGSEVNVELCCESIDVN